ncbi:N-acetylglucosamine/diacetylchitobiose ABC transporter substrate-binding protein [Streptomyces sp. CA-250714]|uniref:N-acetylglucosamine/diacetylchitobiose ABC transporter substrate-binding protein n=1 Tax=Streptomyces sp. CA-250714 TaxID=3240060 RepID=UPI003D91CFA6
MCTGEMRVKPLAAADPRRIGPFRLVGVLGGGGMGRVYLGRSDEGRVVAVKAARAELADDAHFRLRFAREVAAARQVGGPFITPVVAAEPDGAVPWMATAYVPGISLTDAVLTHGALPERAVRQLAAGLVEALTAIHAVGMVHRDLKPSNVLLTAEGPRVIDFGIARSAVGTALTRTGMIIGTPGFMAPEQVSSAGPEVSAAADVFALGGVLTYAATGHGPFGSAEPQILMYRTVHEEPRLERVPDGLRESAAACLAKNPEERPALAWLRDRLGPAGSYEEWLPAPVAHSLLELAGRIMESGRPKDATVDLWAGAEAGEPAPAPHAPPSPHSAPTQDAEDEDPVIEPQPERRSLSRRRVVIALSGAGAATAGGLAWALRPRENGNDKEGRPNPLGVKAREKLSVVAFKKGAGGFGDAYLKDAEKRYRRAFEGAEVTHHATETVADAVLARLKSADPPDLVQNSGASPLNLHALAQDGQLTDLKPLLDAPSLDMPGRTVREVLRPGTITAEGFGGSTVYVLRYASVVLGIWYIPELFEEFGWEYPHSWDAMLEICADAKRQDLAGWTFAGSSPFYLLYLVLPLIGKAGGRDALEAIDNLESGAWRTEVVRDVFEAVYELGAKGYVHPRSPRWDHRASQAAWLDGKALFLPNGSWLEEEMASAPGAYDAMAVGPTPALTASDALPYSTLWHLPSEPFFVPRKAQNPAGGMELLRIMLSRTSARRFTELTGSLTSVADAERSQDLPAGAASAARALARAGRDVIDPRFPDWHPALARDKVGPVLGELMMAEIRPAEAVNRIQGHADAEAKGNKAAGPRH